MSSQFREEQIVQAVMNVLQKLDMMNENKMDAAESRHAAYSEEEIPEEDIKDITATDEQELCLIDEPLKREELLAMKKFTPARTLTGRVGVRDKTLTMFRKNANLAAMVDAVWKPLNREYAGSFGYPMLKSLPESKEEYLMRPDLGRRLDEKSMEYVRTKLKKNPDVQIVLGEGQSNDALEQGMGELLPALLQGLDAEHIDYGTPVFVEYTRIGIGDLIAQEVGAKAACVVLGERPGLLTWRSLGCYITYDPKVDVLESKRTCVSNIQDDGGTPPAEAGAYIAGLIKRILDEKKSGDDLIL